MLDCYQCEVIVNHIVYTKRVTILFSSYNIYAYWIFAKAKKTFRILVPKTSRRVWQKVTSLSALAPYEDARMRSFPRGEKVRAAAFLIALSSWAGDHRRRSKRRCCLRTKPKCMRVQTCCLLSPGQSNIRYSATGTTANHISSQNERGKNNKHIHSWIRISNQQEDRILKREELIRRPPEKETSPVPGKRKANPNHWLSYHSLLNYIYIKIIQSRILKIFFRRGWKFRFSSLSIPIYNFKLSSCY